MYLHNKKRGLYALCGTEEYQAKSREYLEVLRKITYKDRVKLTEYIAFVKKAEHDLGMQEAGNQTSELASEQRKAGYKEGYNTAYQLTDREKTFREMQERQEREADEIRYADHIRRGDWSRGS